MLRTQVLENEQPQLFPSTIQINDDETGGLQIHNQLGQTYDQDRKSMELIQKMEEEEKMEIRQKQMQEEELNWKIIQQIQEEDKKIHQLKLEEQ